MKELNNIKIIAVDHGYGNIKTANTVTPTGITAYDTEPIFSGNILEYNGRYYHIGDGHKEFVSDKCMDEDYYLLTIHEGVTARIMEKQWNVSERCELNRQIRADNRLLRRLKIELQKIAEAVKTSIPKIAKTMEGIFMNLIITRYSLKYAQIEAKKCNEWLNGIKPDYQKYNRLKKETQSKRCLLRDLKSEKKSISKLNVTKQMNLSKDIATLTEDIEELKSELSDLLLYYRDETGFKELCSKISDYEEKHKRHIDIQNTFETRIPEYTKEFLLLKNKIAPDEEAALKKEREMLRPDTIAQAKEHLQSAYKNKFDYNQFAEAKSFVSDLLCETEREYSIRQRLEQAKNQSQKKPELSIPRNNKEFSL